MNSPISKHWQEILALCPSFAGTNEAFCKHHQVSISSFYKYKLMQQGPLPDTSPQFLRVEQCTQRNVTEQPMIYFNTRTGQLTLPATLSCDVIASLINGLSV